MAWLSTPGASTTSKVGTLTAPQFLDLMNPYVEENMISNFQRKTLFEVMQNHLCETLAHFVVFIGSKLGLAIRETAEQSILSRAHAHWRKEAIFHWKPIYFSSFPRQRTLAPLNTWTAKVRGGELFRNLGHISAISEIPGEERSGYIWNMRGSTGPQALDPSGIGIDTIQGWPHTLVILPLLTSLTFHQ
jgi:hypothetical protein